MPCKQERGVRTFELSSLDLAICAPAKKLVKAASDEMFVEGDAQRLRAYSRRLRPHSRATVSNLHL